MTGVEDVGVFIREKVWLENSLSLLANIIAITASFPIRTISYVPWLRRLVYDLPPWRLGSIPGQPSLDLW
jgi:hypothetical protein